MATIVDTEKLRQEIEAERKELERRISELRNELEAPLLEKEAAYRYLVTLGDNKFIQARPINVASALGENIKNRPLIAEIKDLLWVFGDSEFTNAHIEGALGKTGIRPRITNELTKLVDQGILECVHVGTGRAPSRFKVKEKDRAKL